MTCELLNGTECTHVYPPLPEQIPVFAGDVVYKMRSPNGLGHICGAANQPEFHHLCKYNPAHEEYLKQLNK